MIYDVKQYFGLKTEFQNAGYFETDNYNEIFLDLKAAIQGGHLIALTGIVGCGKTTTARKIREDLNKEGKILTSTSLAVDKHRVKLNTLLISLFADLATDKEYKIPTQPELRERRLRELIKQRQKPVALFIDEAHDLHYKTLVGLKRLIEVIQEATSLFSIVLIGQPKLKIDLNRPTLEEIGNRALILTLEGIRGKEREYMAWLFEQCLAPDLSSEDVFTEEAIDFLADRLHTPLQINSYAWKALMEAHQIGQKPVEVETLQTVIAQDLNSLEARLRREGYDMKLLCEHLDAKSKELRDFFKGRLSAGRTQEIQNEMLKLGIAG